MQRSTMLNHLTAILLLLPYGAGHSHAKPLSPTGRETGARGPANESTLDLTSAVVKVVGELSGPEEKAVAMLREEVEKRTQVRWDLEHKEAAPRGNRPAIVIGRVATLPAP